MGGGGTPASSIFLYMFGTLRNVSSMRKDVIVHWSFNVFGLVHVPSWYIVPVRILLQGYAVATGQTARRCIRSVGTPIMCAAEMRAREPGTRPMGWYPGMPTLALTSIRSSLSLFFFIFIFDNHFSDLPSK